MNIQVYFSKIKRMKLLKKIFYFYFEGFTSMTWGKSLWLIILIKLFVIFFVMKFLFFSDNFEHKFRTDEEKGLHVLENLTNKK